MRAAVLYGREDVRVEEIPARPLHPGEVRVAVEAALTCGTDLKVYKRGYHARMIVPPAVFGHEFAGRIVEVCRPAGRRGRWPWRCGDRGVAANSAPCGRCRFCRARQENLCEDLLFLNGAYAESIVVPARIVEKNLLRLQPQTAFADAALTEPLACVVQGIEEVQPRRRERVLVIGAGPIGLMFVALLQERGCRVTVAGRGERRLQTARRLGAAVVVDVGTAGRIPEACDAAGEKDFDVVIEAVGKPETWAAAVELVRPGGRVNWFGGCPAGTHVTLDTGRMHYGNLRLFASFHHTPRSIRKALACIEGGLIRAQDFVDGAHPLSELPALLRRMAEGNQAVKTLIRVQE